MIDQRAAIPDNFLFLASEDTPWCTSPQLSMGSEDSLDIDSHIPSVPQDCAGVRSVDLRSHAIREQPSSLTSSETHSISAVAEEKEHPQVREDTLLHLTQQQLACREWRGKSGATEQ